MKKPALIIIALAVVALVGGGYYYLTVLGGEKTSKINDQTTTNQQADQKEPVVGGDADEHGCLGSAGYIWCESKSKCLRIFEEFCPDKAAMLVSDIKMSTGVELPYKGETAFNWIVNYAEDKSADEEIKGVLYEAQGVKLNDYLKIENYLNSIAEMDNYNMADGVVGGQRGYYYDYMACIINFRHAEMKTNEQGLSEPAGDSLSVKLECGYFNKNDIPKIADREAIRGLFMKKYKLAPASMKITVVWQTESHMRGSVAFLDDKGEPQSGAYFFAKKTGQDWELVLDGNGQISCKLLRDNGFPQEMMNDCVEE